MRDRGLKEPIEEREQRLRNAVFLAGGGFLRDMTRTLDMLGSPIEEKLFHALVEEALASHVGSFRLYFGREEPEPFASLSALSIKPQWPCRGLRPDFELSYFRTEIRPNLTRAWRRGRLLVECDGHDYHDRTKEQASRDRERDRRLTSGGYTVFRFTGSDIHNRPAATAGEILTELRRRAAASEPEVAD